MDIKVAEEIVKAGEESGLDVTLEENYSGRGMFGGRTTGVNADSWTQFVVCVAHAVRYSDDPDAIIEAMPSLWGDHLGHGVVIY